MPPLEQILLNGQPGLTEVRTNLAFDDYRTIAAMNPSTLASGLVSHEPWLTSMKHLQHAWDNPRPDTDDLLWGRALHCLLYEPREFTKRYLQFKGKVRKGEKWNKTVAAAARWKKEILNGHQWESVQAAAQSFIGERAVQELIKAGQSEVTVLVEEDGMQCRGRLDWVSSSGIITDLKTTKNIAPSKFGRDFYAYRYDIKLGLYRRWWSKVSGGELLPVKVIAIEKTPPYDVAVMTIPDAVLDYGAEKGLRLLKELKAAIETNTFLGVAGGEESFLDVPSYEMQDVELEGAEEVAYGV